MTIFGLALMTLGPLIFANGLALVLWTWRPWEARTTLPEPARVPTRQTLKPISQPEASTPILLQRAAQLCRRLRYENRQLEAELLVAVARSGDLPGIIALLCEHGVSTKE